VGRRTTTLVAAGLFLLLALAVAAVATRGGADENVPTPPSTYLPSPGGASGLAEALQRMGVKVERWRRSYRTLDEADSAGTAPLFVVLGPRAPLTPSEVRQLVTQARERGPVLVAGPTASAVMQCWGWRSEYRGDDSIAVRTPTGRLSARPATVHFVLVRAGVDTTRTSMEEESAGVSRRPCREGALRVDTLLVTAGARPVLLRITPKVGDVLYFLSDPLLLANRSLKESDVGPSMLRLLAGGGRGVRFDEFHQGYATGGGLLRAVIEWTGRAPWGWSAWQLACVGLLALLAAMPRTGPIRSVIVRARRSPLEHVRALATALRSARGHDVAVELLVRGLRRRLSRDGRAGRGPAATWLTQLQDRVRSPRARAAAAQLGALTRPGRSAVDVLAAANAVEVVWQELRP
jgi:uncharacterized protein DUF4350